ncbi:hypothetical protein AC578_10159 [Pseudocercospora eumusae]|uniref:C2H2-type domain-containing protein n=1 Tax=Pseudocercospora eumusae TaxID=321146 RepID=A0A139HYJ5_9PEZI|nr:hypothetical protein AC578_10159 [Pseudocercospora eumusae]KXT07534.1 hypothetical protein AC578_10159 [Pseudocercospora eumusae]
MSFDPSWTQSSSYYSSSTGRHTRSSSRRDSHYTQSTSPLRSNASSHSSQSYDLPSYSGTAPSSLNDFADSFDNSSFAHHSLEYDASQLEDLIKEIHEDAERISRSHRNGGYRPVSLQPDIARTSTQGPAQWQESYIQQNALNESAVYENLLQDIDTPPVTDRLVRVNGASFTRYRQLAPMLRDSNVNSRQSSASRYNTRAETDERSQRVQISRHHVPRRPRNQGLYECETCGQTLGREGDLDRHIQTMHGNTYYRCQGPSCLHQCRRRDRMVAHIRNMHAGDPCGYRVMYRDS